MRAAIEMDHADLEAGETRRGVCPTCNGGSSRERSLNVTRTDDGALLYFCWRASCETRGAIGGSPSRIAGLGAPSLKLVRTKPDPSYRFVEPYTVLTSSFAVGQVADFELTNFGVMYDPDTNRLALPVYSPVGRIRGYVLRLLGPCPRGGPKVLAVPACPEPQLGWNLYHGDSQNVIVVEDIPSCIRLQEFNVRAVALNGTHMTDEACDELVSEAERVVFALDRDAFHKSVALEQKLRIHFDKTASLLLPKDFKNMTNKEVLECLESGPSWLRFSDPEARLSALGTYSAQS